MHEAVRPSNYFFSNSFTYNQTEKIKKEVICVQLLLDIHLTEQGGSGGAMVLGKLPVPGRPAIFDYSRARAYCAYSRCGWGLFGHFCSRLSSLFSLPLSGRRPDID